VLQVVLPLPDVDDGGSHLPLGRVVCGLRDGELAGAVGNDTFLVIMKLRENRPNSPVLLAQVRVQDERVLRVEPGVRECGRVKYI
jgi:hypothetical protein